MTKSLTEGKVSKVILYFSIPLLISSVVQQLYNMADSAVVGNFDTTGGLAAIGAAYPIVHFIIGIATGAGMGCTVVISRLFGENKFSELKSAVYTALISFAVLGAVLAAVGIGMSGMFMTWLGVNSEVFDGAKSYLTIYCIGILPMLVYNAVSATFTGIGDSKKPLIFLVASSILNVILDIIAVGVLKLSVQGAAWATVISQFAVAVAAVLICIKKMRSFASSELETAKYFDGSICGRIFSVAVPCILQQITVSIGHILLQGIINTYGTAVMAGYEVGGKIVNFIYGCFNAMATGLMSFAGQNYGAHKVDRCREGLKSTMLVCFDFSLVIAIIGLIFGKAIVGLFVNASDSNILQVVQVGSLYIRIVLVDLIGVSIALSFGGLMRGMGDIKYFVIATVADLGTRVAMSYILTNAMQSYTGIFWAWYFGMAIDIILCIIWYLWQKKSGKLAASKSQA